LTPLAHANPPDSTWISGFYDNADYDDVVLTVTSGVAVVEPLRLSEGNPLWVVVAPAPPSDERLLVLLQLSSYHTRAPPGV
jgi:hypothetical protein